MEEIKEKTNRTINENSQIEEGDTIKSRSKLFVFIIIISSIVLFGGLAFGSYYAWNNYYKVDYKDIKLIDLEKSFYNKVKSFKIIGKINIKDSDEEVSNEFNGEVVVPLNIKLSQNIKSKSYYDNWEPKNLNYETIVINNKIFEKSSYKDEWEMKEFVINPLSQTESIKKLNEFIEPKQKDYKWLALSYAKDIEFIGKDNSNNLYHYKVLPNNFELSSALTPIEGLEIKENRNTSWGRLDANIEGEIWINSDYSIIKEKYIIYPEDNLMGEVEIEIEYGDYNADFSIEQPVDTTILDSYYKKLESGEDSEEAYKQYKEQLYKQDPGLAIKDRDEQRFNEMMIQTYSLLDFYKMNNNEYPISLDDLLYSTGKTPVAPMPVDGSCTEEQNKYVYKRVGLDRFILSFCLGSGREPLPAGFQIATNEGINCISGSTAYYCINKNKTDADNDGLNDEEEQKYNTDLNNSDTDGDGYLDGDEVKAGYDPLGSGGFIDNTLSEQKKELIIEKSDARRISDIKIIQTALELYYNDTGKYPEEIKTGEPLIYGDIIYMRSIPLHPALNNEICKENNEYKYTQVNNGNSYELQYCLDEGLDSLPAGINIASPSGLSNN